MQTQKLLRTARLLKPLPVSYSFLSTAPFHRIPRQVTSSRITLKKKAITTLLSATIKHISTTKSLAMPLHIWGEDKRKRELESDGHKTWGLVIYRCTYKSDSDWSEFITSFKTHVTARLERSEQAYLLDSFVMTVFEDQSLDGATPTLVRDKFKEWAKTAPRQEQDAEAGYAVRYAYCIHVDDEALDSIVQKPDPLDIWDKHWGFVNLIQADWEPYDRFDGEEELEGEEEPIDGCTNYDVGWMRVRYDHVIWLTYQDLRECVRWEDGYIRPPDIRTLYVGHIKVDYREFVSSAKASLLSSPKE